jgi:hypothetical protein
MGAGWGRASTQSLAIPVRDPLGPHPTLPRNAGEGSGPPHR